MDIAILGTGSVGRTLGSKLVSLGHRVRLGSRTATNEAALTWARDAGDGASIGTFAEAAAFGETVFLCVAGSVAQAVLEAAGAESLAGKVVIDVTNPLDFSRGFPPRLSVCNDDSLGETLQRAFPAARLVKTLNTVAHTVMVDPSLVPGTHHLFVCGDDPTARAQVSAWLQEWFGWGPPIDLGDMSNARGTEGWLLLWTRLFGAVGSPNFNLAIVRG